MSAHEPERLYLALAWGHLDTDQGTIDAPIGRSTRHPTRMAVSESGRRAVTHYTVKSRFDEPVTSTLIQCRLETGRTHQIRMHARALGHPILGDELYGYRARTPTLQAVVSRMGRQALHAGVLGFDHPVTGARVRCEAPSPSLPALKPPPLRAQSRAAGLGWAAEAGLVALAAAVAAAAGLVAPPAAAIPVEEHHLLRLPLLDAREAASSISVSFEAAPAAA